MSIQFGFGSAQQERMNESNKMGNLKMVRANSKKNMFSFHKNFNTIAYRFMASTVVMRNQKIVRVTEVTSPHLMQNT